MEKQNDLVKAILSIVKKFIRELRKIVEDPRLNEKSLRRKLKEKLKEFESILNFLEFTRKLTKRV
jgi:hypothetical protein